MGILLVNVNNDDNAIIIITITAMLMAMTDGGDHGDRNYYDNGCDIHNNTTNLQEQGGNVEGVEEPPVLFSSSYRKCHSR